MRGGAVQILELIAISERRRGCITLVVVRAFNSLVTTRALQTIKAAARLPRRFGPRTRSSERVAYREIFECGGTLQMMDPNRVSNLDKARRNTA